MGHMFLAVIWKYRGGRGRECKVVEGWGREVGGGEESGEGLDDEKTSSTSKAH